MKRLILTAATALICALAMGCSVPPARGQAAEVGAGASPSAGSAVEVVTISSDVLPPYEPVTGLSGKITSIGASTTTNLVARVAAEFKRIYPDVELQITASLTSIGPSALLEGRADIVPMNRPLSPEEVQAFVAAYGYPPTEVKVAADALAIYVEKTNPVRGLTLGQLDGIFSRTQRRGGGSIQTWGQLGLAGAWADRPITLYGSGPEDAAHEIFQERVLDGGSFRLSVQVGAGGSAIVQDVAADPEGIGYASIFFAAKRVREVPLAGADGHFYGPTAEDVRTHRYPLSRFLYICVNKPPGQPLGGPAAEFLRLLLSREGQQVVADGGNFPLDVATVMQGRHALAQ
jgi:phosphate transport system substrate-binding protein